MINNPTTRAVGFALARFLSASKSVNLSDPNERDALIDEWIPEIVAAVTPIQK